MEISGNEIVGKNFRISVDNFFNFTIIDQRAISRNKIIFQGITDYLITSNDSKIGNFILKNKKIVNGRNKIGIYKKYVFEGLLQNKDMVLRKKIIVTMFLTFKDVFIIDTEYNLMSGYLKIENVVRNEVLINSEGKNFWSFQGASYPERPDWILPITANYSRENFFGMNSSDYGGGIPLVDIWSTEAGLAIGLIEEKPCPVSMPLYEEKGNIHLRILENRKVDLTPSNNYFGYKTILIPHVGDFFDPLEKYSKIFTKFGIPVRKNRYPKDAYLPQWCAWGYGRDFFYQGQYMEAIFKTLDKVKNLGFGWVVIDDGWQDNYGDWGISKLAFKKKGSDLLKLVEEVHKRKLKVGIWFIPFAAAKTSKLLKNNPDILILNKDSKPIEIDFWNSYYICPALRKTKDITISLVKKLIFSYKFDGLKVDGQHINAAPQCFNESHDHKDAFESYTYTPDLIKIIYRKAHEINRNSVIEICPCGTCASIYNMPSCDLPVASDPTSSFQVRHRGKIFKALMGRNVPYFGDYVELTENGEDFASTVGIGGVPGSMFTIENVDIGQYPLTREKEETIRKWIDIYNRLMLSKGKYLNLYDIVFDYPETHVIKKDGKIYYSLFSNKFAGEFELRGLNKWSEYEVVNCENDQIIAKLGIGKKIIHLEFEHHIFICAKKFNEGNI